ALCATAASSRDAARPHGAPAPPRNSAASENATAAPRNRQVSAAEHAPLEKTGWKNKIRTLALEFGGDLLQIGCKCSKTGSGIERHSRTGRPANSLQMQASGVRNDPPELSRPSRARLSCRRKGPQPCRAWP